MLVTVGITANAQVSNDSIAAPETSITADTDSVVVTPEKKTKFRVISISAGAASIWDYETLSSDGTDLHEHFNSYGHSVNLLIRPTSWIGIGGFYSEYWFYDSKYEYLNEYLESYYGEYEIGKYHYVVTGPEIRLMPTSWISAWGRYNFYSEKLEYINSLSTENTGNYFSAGIRLETTSKWLIGLYGEAGMNFKDSGADNDFYAGAGIALNIGKIKKPKK